MPLESATYIADLVITNPPTSDLETQGANHLQLIKTVLQNVFGTAVRRAVGLPTVVAVSAGQVITTQQAQTTFLTNTGSGAVTHTLPILAAGDAGWECYFVKTTTDLNPVFIQPPSGTIQSGEYTGLAKCRRCIPGRRTRVFWTGSAFIAERVESKPIGAMFDLTIGGLPVGYEWANGQTLSSSASYPEYFALNGNSGLTVDARNRASFGLDNPGGTGTSGRITVAGGNFDGTVLGAVGGLQNHVLINGELPVTNLTFTGNLVSLGTITGSFSNSGLAAVTEGGSGGGQLVGGTGFIYGLGSPQITIPNFTPAGTISSFGGGAAHTILPPALITMKVLVVE